MWKRSVEKTPSMIPWVLLTEGNVIQKCKRRRRYEAMNLDVQPYRKTYKNGKF